MKLLLCFIFCLLFDFIQSQGISNQTEDGCGSNQDGGWLVSLGTNESSKFVHVCGGVLIAPQWILTAANCFEQDETEDDISLWRVNNGDSKKEEFENAAKVKKIIKPKMRNENEYGNDIALVMMEKNLTSNVICLPGNDEITSDDKLSLAGLGQKEIKVSVLDNTQCINKYLIGNKKNLEKDKKQLNEMVCAKQDDRCENHAGGPLMRQNKGIWEVVAIFSIAISCGQESLFTPVLPYLDWIKSSTSI